MVEGQARTGEPYIQLEELPLLFSPYDGRRLPKSLTRSELVKQALASRGWAFNPWTGEGRHQKDIERDPHCGELATWRWAPGTPPLEVVGRTGNASTLDTQVGGDHYKKMGDHQPWVVLKAWLTPEEFRGYMKGTAIAYLARELDKGGMQDIAKAAHTLDALVELSGESTSAPSPKTRG